jgi:hypothetical protein
VDILRSRTARLELVGLWYSYSRPVLSDFQMLMCSAGKAGRSRCFDEEDEDEGAVRWCVFRNGDEKS